jgi:3-hydroxy-9,10-secoandrosta-1,3,5(10)-triene-9,17-dione monooxygenase
MPGEMVTLVDRVSNADAPGTSVATAARGFVPRIRALARRMELARQLDDDLVDA